MSADEIEVQPFEEIRLEVPEQFKYVMIHRMVRKRPCDIADRDDVRFIFLENARQFLPWLKSALPFFGVADTVKALLKLMTPRRRLFFSVTPEGRIACAGWLMVGRGPHFWAAPDEIVFGPVWTDAAFRGRGLAPYTMRNAMNAMMKHGHKVFYSDVHKDNVASQRLLKKLGYTAPMALYTRAK